MAGSAGRVDQSAPVARPAALAATARRLDFIRFDKATVSLDLGEVAIDLVAFEASLQALDWTNCRDLLDAYRGDLLEGMALEETDLSAWLATQRARVRNAMLEAFAALLEAPEGRGNLRTAHALATRLLEIDACQEAAYRALMRSFAASGPDRPRRGDVREMRAKLGSSPTAKTVDLFSQAGARTRRAFSRALHYSGCPHRRGAAASAAPQARRAAAARGENDENLWDIARLVLEDTVIRLCGLRTIFMVAPHTSWQLSDGALDDKAANAFDIGYFLQTDLRRRHGSEEMIVKLFDTRTRVITWADSYSLSIDSLAGSHRALSGNITLALADAVERAEMARFEKDANPQAYYWHLIGQKHLRYMDLPNVRRALKAFRSSVAADPDFAPAYSGSARATQRQWAGARPRRSGPSGGGGEDRREGRQPRPSRRARIPRGGALQSLPAPLGRRDREFLGSRTSRPAARRPDFRFR